MANALEKMSRENDDRFPQQSIAAPLTFLIIFIIFVYGALFVALLGVADWYIHAQNLTFFLKYGDLGVVMMVAVFLAIWISVVFIIAAVPYFILRAKGRFTQARKVALIIILLLFHVFAMPWILWPMIRRNSPTLRKKHRAKLRIMAKGPYMRHRLEERRARLNKAAV